MIDVPICEDNDNNRRPQLCWNTEPKTHKLVCDLSEHSMSSAGEEFLHPWQKQELVDQPGMKPVENIC